ncbi:MULTISPECIES: acetyl-CoA C-acetyltransferase [unclassified Vibrio]|uniref:Acetyl-CoA C-acetyltransferase n=1 Tax=Vibrio sp. HB236076 TaxID=3232307 RepID=A0AB39HBG3_9VIBR|nr:acetyl-CoA C-acetyltransferase [Vibrio sp. HB161653]MDP5253325.1 acetyl-CoA C-acetyltransferase [Vibrio sp. HB161653]
MEKVYIVSAKRSAIGAFGGSLKNVNCGQLGAQVIKSALESGNIQPQWVDEVIFGNVISAAQGMGVARQAAIYAGIPNTVPAYSVNMVCGSGMKSVMDAVSHIQSSQADLVVAGGVEVMSQIPFAMPSHLRDGQKMGAVSCEDLLIHDGLTDVFNQYHMGVTAENIAEKYKISRNEQDEYALNSQNKALAAIERGHFDNEIAPIEVKTRRDTHIFDQDEYPKANSDLEKLARLRPAFIKEGTVTAGNASGLNDGASVTILASASAVEKYQLTPMAEIVSVAQAGVDPSVMGLGPVPASALALQRAGLSLKDINLLELNEAFAAQALGVVKGLSLEHGESESDILKRTNCNGGAIALGHPLGASGNRILVTLLYQLKNKELDYGLASLCVGGGMGTAVIVKTC